MTASARNRSAGSSPGITGIDYYTGCVVDSPVTSPSENEIPGETAAEVHPDRASLHVASNAVMGAVVGPGDCWLDVVADAFPGTRLRVRGNEIVADGPDAAVAVRAVDEMVAVVEQGQVLDAASVRRFVDMVRADERPSAIVTTSVLRRATGGWVRPKTAGQREYVAAMAANTVTFGIGPAGTGKSWLAVAMAVQALQNKEVERIVLTRPAVEAGERLGFLPGDLMAKVDPYLRPLYDALHDMVGPEGVGRLLERGVVEVAPLAFMRGRTLNRSFIILDEAQNTTPEQMKMFLTRLGFGSKVVVTGDRTQADVSDRRGGLDSIEAILAGIDGVAFVHLSRRDVVRHRIVADIVDAYEAREGRVGRSGRN